MKKKRAARKTRAKTTTRKRAGKKTRGTARPKKRVISDRKNAILTKAKNVGADSATKMNNLPPGEAQATREQRDEERPVDIKQ